MSGSRLEAFLARLYVDDDARARFLADPQRAVDEAGLAGEEAAAATSLDRIGLDLSARSFAAKRARPRPPGPLARLWRRLSR